MAIQRIHQHDQAFPEQHTHVVHQRHRRRAGPAVARIHGDEIRSAVRSALVDQLEQLVQPAWIADHGLVSGGFAADVAHPGNHVQQFSAVAHFPVAIGTDGILTGPEAPDASDFFRHLRTRQNPALARLGPLAELDLDHLDLRIRANLS